MKIKTLDIYGYGKWVNQRFDFNDKMQLIYGQNEAGKSTLQSFVRSILFGFPSKHRRVNQLNRYEPRHTDNYGGRILLTDTVFGDVWVERTANGVYITDNDGNQLEENSLDLILGGLDENLFDSFYAFSLRNLQELSNIDSERLGDYFLSIGTVGSDKFLNVAKQLEKDADQIYKAKGKKPQLNQLLNEYDHLSQALERLKGDMARYDALIAEQQDEIETIEELNQNISEIESKIRRLDKLIDRYEVYQKDQAAQRELERLVYTNMDKEAPQQLDDALHSQAESQKLITQMEERIRNLNSEMSSLTRLNWSRNHISERRKWISDTEHIKDVQLRLEHVIERIQEQSNLMANIAREGQFYPEKIVETVNFEQEIEQGHAIQAQIDDLRGQQDSLQEQRKVFLDQRRELQAYSATVRQQYAKLESQRMNEEAQLMQATSLKHYFLGFIFVILGLSIATHHYLYQSTAIYRWLAITLLIIGLLSVFYIAIEHRKHRYEFANSPVLNKMNELKDKDSQYQERSQSLGQDINQREASLRTVATELEKQRQHQQRWLVSLGFYPTADAELIIKSNPVKQYFEAEKIRSQYEDERNDLTFEISKWRNSLAPLLERFPFSDNQEVRALIRHVEETEVSLARQFERGKAMEERIDNAKEIIASQEANIKEKQALVENIYQATNSFDEIDFRQKVQFNQQIEQLKEKRTLYAEQMVGYEEELALVKSSQKLNHEYNQLQNDLIMNKNRLQPHHHQRANLEVAIKQLEQDGSYQGLNQELENKRAQILDLIQEWGRKKIATDLIYQTLRQGMDNPIPEMNKMANEIFSLLTYGRYTQIKLNKTGMKVRQFSDLLFEPHELSQGTLEQLYVALRLAFIANASSMVSMPIMIDDAFVNFDEIRKTSMYHVIEKISEDHQVLFFTFDLQAQETFGSKQETINLDLYSEQNEDHHSEIIDKKEGKE
ncbi:ATP-binding protein [Facklamia lactis]|uniref:ATP-binding protein n=1 Tax=Facklamia lactis TaxID=2749967 RepID=UPI0018CEC319|nr:AAA family ATPase [Facklamia lactis]MBG9980206.1 AAA family ATPase [Facklamia lactis]